VTAAQFALGAVGFLVGGIGGEGALGAGLLLGRAGFGAHEERVAIFKFAAEGNGLDRGSVGRLRGLSVEESLEEFGVVVAFGRDAAVEPVAIEEGVDADDTDLEAVGAVVARHEDGESKVVHERAIEN